jgi:CheY-like chemotaxis protein/HPt (histidine-containing phosphotransfer) domain-containing protein
MCKQENIMSFIKVKKCTILTKGHTLAFLFTTVVIFSLLLSSVAVRHYYEKKMQIYYEHFGDTLTQEALISNSQETDQQLRLTGGLFLLIILVSFVLFRLFTHRFISTPIANITMKAEKDYSFYPDKNIHDEIKKLEQYFEMMSEKVKHDRDALWNIHAQMVKFKELSHQLIKTTTIEASLNLVTDWSVEKFHASFAGVWLETGQYANDALFCFLPHEESDRQLKLVMYSGHNFFEDDDNFSIIPQSLDVISVIAQHKKIETNSIPPENIADTGQWIKEQGIQSIAIYPLIFCYGACGVLVFISEKKYTEAEFLIFEALSHILSVVISNFKLTSEKLTFTEEFKKVTINQPSSYDKARTDKYIINKTQDKSESDNATQPLEQTNCDKQLSYDLRTALNNIMGTAELFHKTDLTEEQRDYLNMIENSSKELALIAEVAHESDELQTIEEEDYDQQRKKLHSVLVVEDNHINKKLIVTILEKADYQVDTADNGLEAFRAYKTKRYELILMDLHMPVMGGFEAAKRIRHWESVNELKLQRTPIVAMTAHVVKGYREKCFQIGFDDYIIKPIRLHDFLKKVEKWIGIGSCKEQQNNRAETEESSEILIDLEDVLNRFQGDKEFFYDMLNEFLIYAPEQIKIISQFLKGQDYKTVAHYVHNLKGAASNLGVKKLFSLCRSFEQIECKKEQTTAQSLVDKMKCEIEELKKYCHTFQTK